MLATTACASSGQEPIAQPHVQTIVVYSDAPPWAYRLGPELFSTRYSDAERIRAELARLGAQLGCHAVVSVVIPSGGRTTAEKRAWGFCAWRAAPQTASGRFQ
jgi:hypothetical protein